MTRLFKKSLLAIASIALLSAACTTLAEPYSVLIGTDSTMVLPSAGSGTATFQAWDTNTVYAQGAMVQNTNAPGSPRFWAVVGGTSTNAIAAGPQVGWGAQTDASVTWRSIPKYPTRGTGNSRQSFRNGFIIVHDATNAPIYMSAGFPAVLNAGARLNQSGGSWTSSGETSIQTKILGISSVTQRVVVLEW